MAADLLPCAWCGSAAVTERPHPGCSMVYCSNIDCPVHAGTGWCDESEEAADVRWNRRAQPLAAPATTTGEDEARAWDHAEDAIEADDDAMEAAIDAFELTPPIEGDEKCRTFRRRQLRRAFRALIEAHPRPTPPAATAAVTVTDAMVEAAAEAWTAHWRCTPPPPSAAPGFRAAIAAALAAAASAEHAR